MVPDAENPSKRSDQGGRRYDFNRTTSRITCCYCGKSFTPNFNEAIRPVLRHFLPMSFPFAACSTPGCPNFGKNVFEFYGRPHRLYRDRKDRGCEAVCRGCQKGVVLGEPLRLHGSDKMRGILDGVLFAFLLGAKKRRTVHFTQMFFPKVDDKGYYRALRNAGARLRSYHTWRNARLLDPQAPIDFSQTARVYTDVIEASLRRLGDVHRHRRVKIIVSALALEKSYFLLAAHPFFLPRGKEKELAPGNYNIDPATGRPSVEITRKWHCLEHPMHRTITLGKKTTPEDLAAKQADVSRARSGYYIEPAYAELAHLLVVRTMLRRFKRKFLYLDAHKSSINSAMVALADEIRSERVEVVLFQRQYKKGGRAPKPTFDMGTIDSTKRAEALSACWEATEPEVLRVLDAGEDDVSAEEADERVKKRNKEKKTDQRRVPVKEATTDPGQRAARAFNSATLGGFSPKGQWAWLRFPSPMGRERECRTLWLTRMPHKSFAEAKQCLRYSTLQPVDSSMRAIRSRVRAIDRPLFRAAAGSSFNERYYDPVVLSAELSIYLFARNYMLMSADQQVVPAWKMGLAGSKKEHSSLTDLVLDFRLDIPHAEDMSAWLRR